jgi:integron integrase
MQLIDLQPFVEFMKRGGLVEERHQPFYVKWVHRFLTAELPSMATSPKDRMQAFSDQLTRDVAIQDWQIQQAMRAVELYVSVFVKEKPGTGVPAESAERGGITRDRAGSVEHVGPRGGVSGAGTPATPASAMLRRGEQGGPTGGIAGEPGHACIEEAEATCVQVRELIRLRHYSYRTEQTYLDWIRRYMAYAMNHEMDWRQSGSVRTFLSYLATQRDVAAATQNQAFSALLFLMREVLKQTDCDLKSVRAKEGTRLPVVLSVDEVKKVLKAVPEDDRLLLELAYGSGLRVSELIRLRVKDLDFDNRLVIVRAAKGNKDRGTLLPRKLVEGLRAQIDVVKRVHDEDLAAGHGAVYLPFGLDRKYPAAPKALGWQYLFPADDLAVDPRSGMVRRHHISDQVPQRIMRDAVRNVGISKPATVHTLRHSFATHLLLKGVNIREVQKYLGHESVETTMIYTHVIRGMDSTAESPLDEL